MKSRKTIHRSLLSTGMVLSSLALLQLASAQAPVDATNGVDFGSGANDPKLRKSTTTNDLELDVGQNSAFSIFPKANAHPTFLAGEGHEASVTAGKWYRIAKSSPSGSANPKQCNAVFSLRDNISTGGQSTVVFRAGISFNDHNRMGVTLLSNTSYLQSTFTELRILENATDDETYLEVKVNVTGEARYSIRDNLGTGAWLPVDWTETTAIPAGYSERKFDIDKLFMVGDFQSRFSIARGGSIGFGEESGGAFPLEITSSGTLRSHGNTILDANGLLSADSLRLGTAPALDATSAGELYDLSRIVTPADPTAQDSATKLSSNSGVSGIAIDASGSRYIAGYFYSSITIGNYTLTGSQNGNAYVAKINASGSVAWAKAFKSGSDGYGFGSASGVSVNAAGEVLVAGYYYGSGFAIDSTHVLTNAGSYDTFVTKLSSNGAVAWAKSLGGTSYDVARAVAFDGSGNAIVTGYFQSSNFANPGLPTLSCAGGYDVFVAKLASSNGTGVWQKRLGGANYDEVASLALDAAGNAYVTGYFSGSQFSAGSFALNSAGSNDGFLVKLSGATGDPAWAKGMGGTSSDVPSSCTVDSGGNVLVAGYFQSGNFAIGGAVFNLATAGGSDAFVARFDGSTGNGLWARSFGGTSYDYATSVTTGAGGAVILGGYFYSPALATPGAAPLAKVGSMDIFFAELNSTANAVNWTQTLGQANSYQSFNVAARAPDGKITISGYANAGSRLGSTPVANSYLYTFDPAWLSTYQPETIASDGLSFYGSKATGDYSLALGHNGISDGDYAFTWGRGNFASGYSSTAWGEGNTASEYDATAWGAYNTAAGWASTAWGSGNTITGSGWESTVWGDYNTVDGGIATAWGSGHIVSGDYATAWGSYNTAQSMGVTVMGFSNIGGAASSNSKWDWIEVDPLLEVANGGWSGNANALTTLKNGQTTLTNKHWKANADNGGDLTADIVPTPNDYVPSDIADPNDYFSHGEALVVEGNTRLKGKVIIEQPQGDISMGAYQ
jgi:hypothetical protein